MPTTATTITQPKTGRDKEETLTHQRTVDEYMALDYPVELVPDGDEWVALNPDLPGCSSFGQDPNSAVENLSKVRKLWIEGELSSGNEVPQPTDEDRYSGKFVLRIPKGLHRLADNRARREGVSLNSLIGTLLSGALGYANALDKLQQGKQRYYTYCSSWESINQGPYEPVCNELNLLTAFNEAWSKPSTKNLSKSSIVSDENAMIYLHHFAGHFGSYQKGVFAPEDYRYAKEKHFASK